MPKREKTPEAADDEPKFLAIHCPYPAHANLENLDDTKALGRWLGSIIAPQYLLALHHKPSASNMVIVEIERTRPHDEWRSLLGLHRWNDFLVSPTDDEKSKASRVYFCTYTTGRQVQKAGWKRIDVDDAWFIPESQITKNKLPQYREDQWQALKQKANVFKNPYPLSIFCELPTEDPTNLGLARNLPVQYFPREKPQPTPKTVPGSDQWVSTKLNSASAWGKAKPNSTPKPTTPSPVKTTSNEPRGRLQKNFVPSGVPLAPPGLPLPHIRSLPPGLTHTATTTDSSNSSDVEFIESRTAAFRINDETDIAIEGSDSLHELNTAHIYQPTISSNGIVDSLWDEPPPKARADVILCNVHNVVCSKGVCTVYSDQLKVVERQKKGAPQRGRGRGGGAPYNRGRNGAGGGYVKTVMSRNNDAPRGGNRKGPNGRAGTGRNAVDDDSSEVVAAKGSGVEDWSAGWSNEPPNGSKPQRGWGGSEASEKQKAADPNSWETASLGPW